VLAVTSRRRAATDPAEHELQQEGFAMCVLTSIRTRSTPGIVAGAVLALALSAATAASAQTSAANPFAAPKQAASKPETSGEATEAKATPVKVEPAAEPGDDLVEEHTFLTAASDKGPYRLEVLIVRPAKVDGRLPIALITHGKNAAAAENQSLRPDFYRPQARAFAARGWLAVVVIRRGFGQSDGFPGVSRGAAYMSCQNSDLVRGFDIEADDLDGALRALRTRPDADGSRVIAVGQSLGGGAVLAFAARRPAGLLAVVNVSGGVWRSDGNGGACDYADLVDAMATFGARTGVPTLWLYSQNDSLFPPALVTRMRAAYAQSGGRAELTMFPPVLGDGHALFTDAAARMKWLIVLDAFMHAHEMPNALAQSTPARPVVTGAVTPAVTTR
jgi:dienelactone hydrolase